MALTDGASVVTHRGQQKRQSGPCRDPFVCIGFVKFVNSILVCKLHSGSLSRFRMKYVDTVIVTKLFVLDVAAERFHVAVHVFKPKHTQLMNNTFCLHNS